VAFVAETVSVAKKSSPSFMDNVVGKVEHIYKPAPKFMRPA